MNLETESETIESSTTPTIDELAILAEHEMEEAERYNWDSRPIEFRPDTPEGKIAKNTSALYAGIRALYFQNRAIIELLKGLQRETPNSQ